MVQSLNYVQVAVLASIVDRLAVRPCAHQRVDSGAVVECSFNGIKIASLHCYQKPTLYIIQT